MEVLFDCIDNVTPSYNVIELLTTNSVWIIACYNCENTSMVVVNAAMKIVYVEYSQIVWLIENPNHR